MARKQEALAAQHQADIAEAIWRTTDDLTLEMEAKFQECLDGLKASQDSQERKIQELTDRLLSAARNTAGL